MTVNFVNFLEMILQWVCPMDSLMNFSTGGKGIDQKNGFSRKPVRRLCICRSVQVGHSNFQTPLGEDELLISRLGMRLKS
jgi:hypothetical protein